MPIYAYKCASCGFAKDVLQKISDAPLTTCPTCGKEEFSKQLTAAGFQLKGSGWYVTDFRDGGKPKDSGASASKSSTDGAASSSEPAKTESKAESTSKSESAPAAAPAAATSSSTAS